MDLNIYNKKILLYTLLVMAIVGTFVPNFNILVPVFTKEVLKQNEVGFGSNVFYGFRIIFRGNVHSYFD